MWLAHSCEVAMLTIPGGSGAAEKAVDVSRLDLRVGRILRAWKHPDADTLYVEEGEVVQYVLHEPYQKCTCDE